MAKTDEFKKQDENLENVNEALSTTGQWIEDHSNMLMWIILAVAAVVLGVIAINNYVIKPKHVEASNEIAKCIPYFNQGDWQKALDGDDADCIGFAEIADSYHSKQGKLAALYAGICYYQLGQYDEAATNLKKFNAKDLMVDPAANQLLGDAYVQMDELSKAAAAFRAAADSHNELIAPMSLKKLGFVQMEMGDYKAANQSFVSIKNDYPASTEAQDIQKYIEFTQQ